jgi:hypothetical protein
MNDQQPQTVTIGDKTYPLEDLSNEVKELLSLHAQAQDMMISARRQAVIHELSASNLATMIKSKVDVDESTSDPEGPLEGHVVQ